MARFSRAVLWFAAIAGVIVVLRATAAGDLAPPPISSVDALAGWAEARTPPVVALALVRLGAEIAAWYLLGLSVLQVVGRAPGLHAARRLADALSVAGTQRVVALAMGLTAATAAPWTAADQPAAPSVVVEADPSAGTEMAARHAADVVSEPLWPSGRAAMTPLEAAAITAPGSAAMRPLVPVASGNRPPPTPGVARMVPTSTATEASTSDSGRPEPATWTVRDGESFWSIATSILNAGSTATASPTAHDRLWRSLIEINRDRLADPSNPDLIYPGQVFVVPPIPRR